MNFDRTKLLGLKKLGDILFQYTGMKRNLDIYNLEFDKFKIEQISDSVSEATARGALVEYIKEGLTVKSNPELLKMIHEMPESNQLERAEKRQAYQKVKAQDNIEQTVMVAAEQLAQEENISEDSVDEGWLNRFFKIVEDVPDEEMQKLWGRILAGEIKQPKSFSIRTLEQVKLLSQSEANLITLLANFLIDSNGFYFIYKPKQSLTKFGLNYLDITKLSSIGILANGEGSTIQLSKLNRTRSFVIRYSKGYWKCNIQSVPENFYLKIFNITDFGIELFRLLKTDTPDEYIAGLRTELEENNIIVIDS